MSVRLCPAYMCKVYGYHSNDLIKPNCGGTGLVPNEYCYEREDETHCEHWWDGEPCCSCEFTGGEISEVEP